MHYWRRKKSRRKNHASFFSTFFFLIKIEMVEPVTAIVRLVNIFGFISAGVFKKNIFDLNRQHLLLCQSFHEHIHHRLFEDLYLLKRKNRHRIQRFRMKSSALPFFSFLEFCDWCTSKRTKIFFHLSCEKTKVNSSPTIIKKSSRDLQIWQCEKEHQRMT